MKLYSGLLAFCAIQQATSFNIQAAKKPALTRLGSTIPGAATGTAAPTVSGTQTAPLSYKERKADPRFDKKKGIKIQGSTLRTCSFNENVNRVQVLLETEGRPLNANVDLWQGPDNAPQKMAVYIEDGSKRPFNAIVETPGAGNAIAIRNTAPMEFPLSAFVESSVEGGDPAANLGATSKSKTVQGGAVYTVPFDPSVASVQILLTTDGRPMKSRIELLQGPNNNKQVLDVYTEDGNLRPFYIIVETPGDGNVVRIVNSATLEYPLEAHVEPYLVDTSAADGEGMLWS